MSKERKWGTDVQGTHLREGKAGHNVPFKGNTNFSPKKELVYNKLERIAEQARQIPDMSFNNVMHNIDLDFLYEAYRRVNKRAKPGIDGVTAKEYSANLELNLRTLLNRMREGTYKAPPVKRAYIEKSDGGKRPLGLPAFEDKIVQMAVSMILTTIYEVDFYDNSYGSRKGRNAHMALKEFRDASNSMGVSMVVDADVSGYFDSIDHRLLKELLRRRVSDKNLLRMVSKWLHAGVLEGNVLSYSSQGTPQGGVISPVLANIFLHYVLDEWFIEQIQPLLAGKCKLVRYVDDFLVAFSCERDAYRFMEVLPKRFAKYGLTIHPKKTKLVTFKRPYASCMKDKVNGTFDFLGFTHYWGKSLKGYWVLKRQTMRTRLRRSIKAIWRWCRNNRHMNIVEQYKLLVAKLRGHYQYYGVRCNIRAMEVYLLHVSRAWKVWLSKRCSKGNISWDTFKKKLETTFILPTPKILHNI